MEFAVFTEPQQGATYDDLLRVALEAERLGFDAFFRSDHYLFMGDRDPMPGPSDAWTTLAGLARDTTTINLGTLVTSGTFRLPGPLAVTVANVDAMSGGRVELGLGAGWFEAEHTAYGIPFPDTAERFDRLEEQLAIVTGMWATPVGETFSFSGKHYTVTDSPALPKPHQAKPRVIVGGRGKRRTPRLAAAHAEEFNLPFAPLDVALEQNERVRRACEDAGRDPATMRFSSALVLCVGADQQEFLRRAETIGHDPAELRREQLGGTVDEVVEKVRRYRDAGTDRLFLQALDLADLDHLRLVASDVIPAAIA
jgi:F420-dependent oxidoreductase-like protein